MKLSQLSLVFSLVVLGLSTPSALRAEDAVASQTPDIPKPLKVLPSKIKPIQTGSEELSKAAPETSPIKEETSDDHNAHLDSLTPWESGLFPSDFWTKSNQKDLTDFLKSPYSVSYSRAARALTLRAVLTPSSELTDSGELYTLRLEKLNAMGAYTESQTLYKMNESDPPSAEAAQAGVEASLGHGNIAPACLDQKALPDNLKTTSPLFWSHLDVFCQALLGPAVATAQDTQRVPTAAKIYLEATKSAPITTIDALNTADAVTLIAFIKTGQILSLLDTPEKLRAITDRQLGLILSHAPLTTAYFPALAEGLYRGIVSDKDAVTRLQSTPLTGKPDSYTAFLKEYQSNKEPLLTAKLLDLADTPVKQTLLLPLYSKPDTPIPEAHKDASVRLLAIANQDIPTYAATMLLKRPESSAPPQENQGETGESLLLSALETQTRPRLDTDKNETYATILALKSANYPQNAETNPYDNIFNLTPSGNYVMPMGDILSNLKKSADQKQIHQVVIGSLTILNTTPPDKLHPAALYRVLSALNSAGFNEETLSLSREVLGTVLEKLYKEK